MPAAWAGGPRSSCGYTTRCIIAGVGRTNIEIDDALIARAMARYRLPTKRAAVDYALRRLVGTPMSREEILAMEGSGWEGDLDEMRRWDPPDPPL